jgi:peptidoglycan hydrolase-like protein with peptidoglycan-binding domain
MRLYPNYPAFNHSARAGRLGAVLTTLAVTVLGAGLALAAPAAAAPAPITLTSSSCPTNISSGENDGCVTELQKLLNSHGASVGVDGIFGSGTLSAVKAYQGKHGLSVDGIVGPASKDSLYATSGAPTAIALTSSRCPADIEEGEVDGCVTQLQTLLNSHGAGLTVDGDFGGGTFTAVKNYQSAHGLAADGIVGANTKASLDGAGTSAPAPISITSSSCPTDIQSGEHDGCVTELQQLLNAHGAGLTVDGDFGAATLAAVKDYQSVHGLSADGIVGPGTKSVLMGGSDPTPPPPPSGSTLSKIISYAQAIQNGSAEPPAWNGGKIQYVWGGGHHSAPGPSTGTCVGDPQSLSCSDPAAVGLDCSGFARWVYSLAYGKDVLGSGGTGQQIGEMRAVSSPVPGDLAFFGTSASNTEHVGIYIGNGQMINSYETGTVVQTNTIAQGGHLIGYYQY